MTVKQIFLTTATAAFFLTGCTNDDGSIPPEPDSGPNETPNENPDENSEAEPLPYENGILVLNEGNFGAGNASVSFVSNDILTVENGVFGSVNGTDAWGDTAQSMAFDGDMAYIVVNNSQKVEVVDRYTFASIATIGGPDATDFLNPRYMAIANGKGYVTNWGDGTDPNDDFVAVVNLENYTVETKIPIPEGPERLLAKGDTVYVALLGGFNFNDKVGVIDASSNTLTDSIAVAKGPNSLQLDDDGNLWVLSGGKPAYTGDETPGQLDKINTVNNRVAETWIFPPTEHPVYLSQDDGNLYYSLAGNVFKMNVSDTALPEEAEITGVSFYDMVVEDQKLYGADAKDFASNGSLEIYDLSDNTLVDSKEVGINPGAIYFNGAAEQ